MDLTGGLQKTHFIMFVVILTGIGAGVGADVWPAFGDDALAIHTDQRTGTGCAASALPAGILGRCAINTASVFQTVVLNAGFDGT